MNQKPTEFLEAIADFELRNVEVWIRRCGCGDTFDKWKWKI